MSNRPLAESLELIDTSRTDIKAALEEKGVSLENRPKVSEVAEIIKSIPSGSTDDSVYIDFQGFNWQGSVGGCTYGIYEPVTIEIVEGIPPNITWDTIDFGTDLSNYREYFDISELMDRSVVVWCSYGQTNIVIYYQQGKKLKVKNLCNIFRSFITAIQSIDFSKLDVSECINFDNLFSGLFDLQTIYCNQDWTEINPLVSTTTNMFEDSAIASGDVSGKMAKPNSKGGYFTEK